MNEIKKVYALFPYDKDGKIAGVYVGSTRQPAERMRIHKNTPNGHGKQDELHELMRTNGFYYVVVDEYKSCFESYIEFDWLDFFIKRTKLKIFNNFISKKADWTRIQPKEVSA